VHLESLLLNRGASCFIYLAYDYDPPPQLTEISPYAQRETPLVMFVKSFQSKIGLLAHSKQHAMKLARLRGAMQKYHQIG
jgi:hypothetical protein